MKATTSKGTRKFNGSWEGAQRVNKMPGSRAEMERGKQQEDCTCW